MAGWIITTILYVLVVAFFSFLGGFRAAGEAFRHWGERATNIRAHSGSSSS
jgi:hypothetical protein